MKLQIEAIQDMIVSHTLLGIVYPILCGYVLDKSKL